ncbi:hypothetical protein ABPG75_000752 [Micractinium tetrahymenae]
MPWQLSEFLAERVQRARRLLAESEEHRGSAELAEFVEAMELTERLHRLLMVEQGQTEIAIQLPDAVQAMAICVRIAYLDAPEVICDAMCRSILLWLAETLVSSSQRPAAVLPCLHLLSGAASSIVRFYDGAEGLAGRAASKVALEAVVQEAGGIADGLAAGRAGSAAQLDAALASACHGFQLTASQVQQACLKVQLDALDILSLEPGSTVESVARFDAARMLPVQRRLTALDASQPRYHLNLARILSNTLDSPAAAAELRTAARLAEEYRRLAFILYRLATKVMSGAEGPRFSKREVQTMLQRAQQAERLCKRWLPGGGKQTLANEGAAAKQMFEKVTASQPGRDSLQAARVALVVGSCGVAEQRCAGCSELMPHLRLCAQCRSCGYCRVFLGCCRSRPPLPAAARAVMPWQLNEFQAERVARARRLLAESEEHRGSAELAEFVEAMELTERLHRLLLDERMRARADFGVQESIQNLATFLRINYLAAPEGTFESNVIASLMYQAKQMASLASSAARQAVAPSALASLARAAACIIRFRCTVPGASAQSREGREVDLIAGLAGSVADQLGSSQTAAELDAALAAAGLSFQLTARQVQQVCLEVQGDALVTLGRTLQPEPSSVEQLARHSATLLVPLARRLVAMDASRRKSHTNLAYALANTLDFAGAAAALRTVVQLATEQRAYHCLAQNSYLLIEKIIAGGEGPQFSKQRLQQLLEQGKRAEKLCKPWLSSANRQALAKAGAAAQDDIARLASGQPGRDILRAPIGSLEVSVPDTRKQRCSGCGRHVLHLRRCAQCRSIVYCSWASYCLQ